MRAKPEICLERIRKRHRSEEESINLDYLQALHEHHEEWLMRRNYTSLLTPVLIVDANQTKERVCMDTNTCVKNLLDKFT